MGDDKPDPKAFIDNLKGPMTIQKKLFSLLKNNALKIITERAAAAIPVSPGVDRGLNPLPVGEGRS